MRENCEIDMENRFPQADPDHCPTYLYRYFDADDRLLYVGITYCFHTRADQHSMTALWWRHARRVTCELFPSRSMATCAERHVIHDEEPIHNGHRKQPPKKPFEPDEWFFKQQGKRWVGVDPEEWTIGPNGLERSYGDQAVKVARTI